MTIFPIPRPLAEQATNGLQVRRVWDPTSGGTSALALSPKSSLALIWSSPASEPEEHADDV